MTELRSVAVIGAGRHGLSFAERCVAAGMAVTLEDVLSSRLRQAQESMEPRSLEGPGTLRLMSTVEDAVREADVAIDFVPDELESKLEIFSLLDRMAPPHTLLCTPTTLSITDLASCTYRRERCVAIRFAAEEGSAVVQLVRGVFTTEETAEQVETWLQNLGFQIETAVEDFERPTLPS